MPILRENSCFNPRARAGRDTLLVHAGTAHVQFQSTRPRGARHVFARQPYVPLSVSIHAPARGATAERGAGDGGQHSFNPRARAGRDVKRSVRRAGCAGFNPRARAGRDARWRCGSSGVKSFNPRARAGRDGEAIEIPAQRVVFQSTRPRGARRENSGPPESS